MSDLANSQSYLAELRHWFQDDIEMARQDSSCANVVAEHSIGQIALAAERFIRKLHGFFEP
jgi:hypothetical protein